MPNFKIEFEREYTITEGFSRVIEAEDREAAIAKAEQLAGGYDHDCPDDCSETGGEGATSFGWKTVTPTEEAADDVEG